MPLSTRDEAIAAELQRLRHAMRRTGGSAARAMGWSTSKISRIESAQSGITLPELDRLLCFYQVPDERRGQLLTRARDTAVSVFPDDPLHGAGQACSALEWAPLLVPALLQTTRYAEAALRATLPALPPYQVRDTAAALAEWQARLGAGLTARAVVDESALTRLAGTRAVMDAQLAALARPRRDVQLRVMLADAAGPWPTCPFTCLEFPREHDLTAPGVTLLPAVHGTIRLDDEHDTWPYQQAFEALWRAAADPADPVKRAREHVAAW